MGGARLGTRLHVRIPEILAEWDELSDEEPWGVLPAAARIDGLPEVTGGIIHAAVCQRGDRAELREALHAAAEHGRRRQTQGVSPDGLLREYRALREAFWRVLRRLADTEGLSGEVDAIRAVDLVIAQATRAALYGAHRDAFEANGTWPAVVDAIVEEWSPSAW